MHPEVEDLFNRSIEDGGRNSELRLELFSKAKQFGEDLNGLEMVLDVAIALMRQENVEEDKASSVSNGISPQLHSKLKEAFSEFLGNIENPLVIAHLKNESNSVQFYLIAYDSTENLYYGIVENEFVKQRQICGIPLSNISAVEVGEVPMKPFRAKLYIEEGIKIE